MPVSEKQLAANRANARRSTGPRTPEGKARAARNATKHGFAGSTYTVVRLEDLHEIDNLKEDLFAVYQPVNSQEVLALERMANAQQAMLRASRLEAGMFTTCLDDVLDRSDRPMFPMSETLAGDGDIEICRAQNRNFALALGFRRMAVEGNSFSLFLRYQAQAERQYRRTVEDFERLRALRPPDDTEIPNGPISDPQPEEPASLPPRQTNPFPTPEARSKRPIPPVRSTHQPVLTSPPPADSICNAYFTMRPTPCKPLQ